jgi:hypothetical protein
VDALPIALRGMTVAAQDSLDLVERVMTIEEVLINVQIYYRAIRPQ